MPNYTQIAIPDQLLEPEITTSPFGLNPGEIKMATGLSGFVQISDMYTHYQEHNKNMVNQEAPQQVQYIFPVKAVEEQDTHLFCPKCSTYLKRNVTRHVKIKHLPYGNIPMVFDVEKQQFVCINPDCGHTEAQEISFKDPSHRITHTCRTFVEDLLKMGLTLKEVSRVSNVDKNIVKEIDKTRLLEKYTVDGAGKKMKPPEEYSPHLGIDEFLLHKGHQYATIIIDLDTGHVLYIAKSKKKQVVYDFMKWVGDDWMKHVEAIACDMNADFEEAFRDKYPDIKVVFDYFHLVKNFNDKVVTEVRKDEFKRLKSEGRDEEAARLKGARFILTSRRETLAKHDLDIGKIINPGSELFNIPVKVRELKLEERYDELIRENKLFFTIDLIKEALHEAYRTTDVDVMKKNIGRIIGICYATENKHFKWFGNLLKNHLHGILTHAGLQLSSGKVEGTNRMIKTIRWQAYGFGDDEYFFLKIMDASRAA